MAARRPRRCCSWLRCAWPAQPTRCSASAAVALTTFARWNRPRARSGAGAGTRGQLGRNDNADAVGSNSSTCAVKSGPHRRHAVTRWIQTQHLTAVLQLREAVPLQASASPVQARLSHATSGPAARRDRAQPLRLHRRLGFLLRRASPPPPPPPSSCPPCERDICAFHLRHTIVSSTASSPHRTAH